jgi:hypothetical protein
MRKFAKSKILIWKNQKMIVVKMGGLWHNDARDWLK